MLARLARRLRQWLTWPLRRARPSRPASAGGAPSADGQASLGPISERLARAFLERAGFRILQAGYRCPLGELDLVAQGEGRLVFVEVKARRLPAQAPSARQHRDEAAEASEPGSPLPLGEGAGVRVGSEPPAAPAPPVGRPANAPRPEDAVTRAKQKKIGQAAKYYCRAHRCQGQPARFDVIAIDWPPDGDPIIRHHKAAFRPDV